MADSNWDLSQLSDAELNALIERTQNAPAAAPLYFDRSLSSLTNQQLDSLIAQATANQEMQGQRRFAGGAVNALNAVTFGFGDEIAAGGAASIDSLSRRFTGAPGDFRSDYDKYLQLARDTRSEFRGAHPYVALGSDVVGALALPNLGIVKQGVPLLRQIPNVIKEGAVLGGLYGLGESEGGLSNRLEGAAKGGVVGGAVSGALPIAALGYKAASRGLTNTSREQIVGQLLEDAAGAGAEQRLGSAIESSAQGFGPKTFAEVVQTPNAANIERQMVREIDGGGQSILQSLADRQNARVDYLKNLGADVAAGVTPDVRGAKLRLMGKPSVDAMEQSVNKIFEQIKNSDAQMWIDGLSQRMAAEAQNLGKGYNRLPSEVQAVLNKLTTDKGSPVQRISLGEWHAIRSQAGSDLVKYAQDNPEVARFFGVLREELDSRANALIQKKGLRNLSGDLQTLKKGIDAARYQKETFEQNVIGNVFAKGSNSGYRMRDSAIPTSVIQTPEAAKQFMKAFGRNSEAVQQARGALLDDMMKTSPDMWGKYFKEKLPQFREIFQDDLPAVQKVLSDLESEMSVGRLNQAATGRGPITSQMLTTKDAIQQRFTNPYLGAAEKEGAILGGGAGFAIGGGLGGGVVGGLLGKGIGTQIKNIGEKNTNQMMQMLVSALRDPKVAQQYMQAARTGDISGLSAAVDNFVRPTGRVLAIQSGRAVSSPARRNEEPAIKSTQKMQGISPLSMKEDRQRDTTSRISQKQRNTQTRPIENDASSPDRTSLSKTTQPRFSLATASASKGLSDQQIFEIGQFGSQEDQAFLEGRVRRYMKAGKSEDEAKKLAAKDYRSKDSGPSGLSLGKLPEAIKELHPFVQAIIKVESGGNPLAESKKGAKGLMQIMPAVAKAYGIDPTDPVDNIRVGTQEISQHLERFGDARLALIAYNWGQGNLAKLIKRVGSDRFETLYPYLPSETQKYVGKVEKKFRTLTEQEV